MDTENATEQVADEAVHADSAAAVADEAQAAGDQSTDQTQDSPDGEEPEGSDQGEDEAEIEIDGQKFRVPKALEGAFMKNADYTRKTQELAENRRSVEAAQQALADRQAEVEALSAENAKVHSLKSVVDYYDQVDWDALDDQDPERANKEYRKYQQAQRDLSAAERTLAEKKDERLKSSAAEKQRQLQEAGRVLGQKIPGWGQPLANKLVETAVNYGIPGEELVNAADPRVWQMLHDAHQWRQHQTKQTAGQRQVQQQATAPVKTLGRRAPPPSPLSERASTEAWMKARSEQARKAGR